MSREKNNSVLPILIFLTLVAIAVQTSLFLIHYKVSELIDSLVQSSLSSHFTNHVVLLPIILFLFVQIFCYALYIAWIGFIATLSPSFFNHKVAAIFLWFCGLIAVITLNNHYFSHSFFTSLLRENAWYDSQYNDIFLMISAIVLITATFFAYFQYFFKQRRLFSGSFFLLFLLISLSAYCDDQFFSHPKKHIAHSGKPNIILIGLDSLRPDFTGYFGNKSIQTPYIDAFLKDSDVFTQAYVPLARTFPSWMSILTGKYPKHHNARSNLSDPSMIIDNDNLAKRLKQLGYETTYGTDEKRFSNITERYGFNHVIGPLMGVNDFILGSLSDFPLSNVLINSPLGRWLFPYNYANRAAAITYQPDSFLRLITLSFTKLNPNKPQLIAMHFCLTHWPYTWAHDGQPENISMAKRYYASVEAVDQQLGKFISILKDQGLLENAIIILLSDHGTTLGLPHDRVISKLKYQGKKDQLKFISYYKLGYMQDPLLDFSKVYSMSTSYGQGTDILSLKQNHVLLAFKNTQQNSHSHIDIPVSLMDITPTLLSMLHLTRNDQSDGISLIPYLQHPKIKFISSRPLFMETGFSLSEIETDNIFVNQVVNKTIGAYEINPKTGLLSMKIAAENSIIHNKQRAVLLGDWFLARYPASSHSQLRFGKNNTSMVHYNTPPYFVLVNLKTGLWTIGLTESFSKYAPAHHLLKEFYGFYGDEI